MMDEILKTLDKDQNKNQAAVLFTNLYSSELFTTELFPNNSSELFSSLEPFLHIVKNSNFFTICKKGSRLECSNCR